jgi:hypothetical protein
MTLQELEARVVALEKAVAELEKKVGGNGEEQGPWWITEAGRFANDPGFEEMVRLGRKYRESLRPGAKKKKKKAKPKRRKSDARS